MKIAITGGTGFVGRNIARLCLQHGHQVVIVSRGQDRSGLSLTALPEVGFFPIGLDGPDQLAEAFQGCQAVVHCAGINRETGRQTYQRVHVDGTRHVIEAAGRAGLHKIVLISFLRARPDCGSAYHETKWQAEELVRNSGLDYTILKCGVIYGKGDHMLDHLSHAFFTFPLFAFVGFKDQLIRPIAVEDLAGLVVASLLDQALSNKTLAIVGPETLTLRQAVRRVAKAVRKRPLMFPMPVWFHYALGWGIERIMTVPMVSVSQVRMLIEGVAEPLPACEFVPANLAPRTVFGEEQIRKGLPPPGGFGLRDIKCCRRRQAGSHPHGPRVFFEAP
jgi:NADH dehydrogenase